MQDAHVAKEEPAATQTVVKTAEPSGAMPSFRWPVRGRVIAGFGSKPNGTQNDGINLAVPEGTPIKAADDGVVAYAGNELKGYGNLVLIRHTNGFVSAYAHASELMVKRGDTVKRGQVIAHAGQTGNVTSPQLHFEIRKGSTPVDPTSIWAVPSVAVRVALGCDGHSELPMFFLTRAHASRPNLPPCFPHASPECRHASFAPRRCVNF